MTHILRLISGDKRSPTRNLTLADGTSTGNIYLRLGGFSPGPGPLNLQMSGQTIRADGQTRVASSRDNIEMTISYDLRADSYQELFYLQNEINQFLEEARYYHERGYGEQVYLHYRWGAANLDSMGNDLTWGQWGYFFPVISGNVASWPTSLHTGALVAGNIESIQLDLVCEPYAQGFDQFVMQADGIPGVDSDVDLSKSLTGAEFDGNWSIAGWIHHRDSDYYVFEAHQDAADWINVFWDESDNRFELNTRKASSTTTTNGSTQGAILADDPVHICVVSNGSGSAENWYVNGTAQSNGPTGADWGNVTFTVGSATSAGAVTANTAGLDAWKLFNESLTAAEVLALWTAEKKVKDQTRGDKLISPLPYLKTRSGDDVFENVDGILSTAAKDNWGILGGVPGDVEATVKWEIDPGSATPERVFWLGRQASQATFTPDGTLWLDYSGTSDSGNSSGDANEQITGQGEVDFDATISGTPITGDFQVLARFKATSGAIMQPYYQLGTADEVKGDKVTIGTDTDFMLQNFGRLKFDWRELRTGGAASAGLIGQRDSTYPMNGLTSFWTLEEASGNRSDVVGSVTLTDNGSSVSRGGKIGNAADMDGTTDYLSATDPATLEPVGSFTIAGWFLLDTIASSQIMVAKWHTTNGKSYQISYNNPADRFRLDLFTNTGTTVTIDADALGAVTASTWYLIIAKYNAATNTAFLKINDKAADTSGIYGGINQGTADFVLGAGSDAGLKMNGGIDEVGFWTRALTIDEEATIYAGGTGMFFPGSATFGVDFIQLLPSPSARIEAQQSSVSASAGDLIIIDGRLAYMYDTSGDHVQTFEFEGDDVTVLPDLYNYIFLLEGQENRLYPVSNTNTLTGTITPRYLLPGV